MSTEDSMREATKKLDEAAGAAPTTKAVYGDKDDKKGADAENDAQDEETTTDDSEG